MPMKEMTQGKATAQTAFGCRKGLAGGACGAVGSMVGAGAGGTGGPSRTGVAGGGFLGAFAVPRPVTAVDYIGQTIYFTTSTFVARPGPGHCPGWVTVRP